ncbi:MAG: DNA primase [Clostridia bacterium]|nr:DNA primase [Clostridia bacterium]
MYNYYSDELIEEVRINNDIADVVSEYVKLEKKGKDFFGLCPFHKEKTPSFCVVPGKQIFYCFGCGKGGNVIHFIMNAENLDFIEAIKLLAERARIQLPEGDGSGEQEKAALKREIISINTEAARFYYNNLNSRQGEIALRYLRDRGLSEQTIRRFGIGYSTDEWDLLFKYLVDKGFSEELILKSGLVIPNKKGGYYDRFRERVIFPIFDIRGNVIAFGGRIISRTADKSQPKYVNSPETPVYSKGKNLYALNLAKNSGQNKLLVVEGYMDVISLHQCGIINTVASLGTALTESQGRMLKKYAQEIIISYDADTAGQAATLRGLDILNDIGCNVKVLRIPEGKDPDEFVRKNGPKAMQELIENSITLLEYKAGILKNSIDTGTTEGKINFLNKLSDLLVKVDNNIEREVYIKKLAKEFDVNEEAIYSEIYRKMRPRSSFRKVTAADAKKESKKTEKVEDSGIRHDERMLLALLCTDNSVYKKVRDKLAGLEFTGDENRKIAQIVLARLEDNRGLVAGELLNLLEPGIADEFTRIIQQECNCEDNYKAVLDIIKRMEAFRLSKRQQQILQLLGNKSHLTEGDVEKLKQELNSILLRKKSL